MDAFHEMIPEEYQTGTTTKYNDLAALRCEVYNSTEGHLPGFRCDKCKNRGYFAAIDGDGNDVRRECECMKIRKADMLMANSGMQGLIERCSFENYMNIGEWSEKAKSEAIRYANSDESTWLLFSGQTGAGKTHLCTAICSTLMRRGYSVRYVLWSALFKRFEGARFSDEKHDRIIRELIEPDILYIDDFLKCPNGKNSTARPSDSALSYALDAINVRYNSRKRTIISTEFFSDRLMELDAALGGRISEMSANSKIQIAEDPTRNYRVRYLREKR